MIAANNQIVLAALMPHAPVLVPPVGGDRSEAASHSVRAMEKASRRIVGANPDTVVLISPHTPRRPGAFAMWTGLRLRGSFAQFGAPEAAIDLPADQAFSEILLHEAGIRGVKMWWLRDQPLDHGATVPLWHLCAAGWSGPTIVLGLNYPGEPGLTELGEAIAAAAQHSGRRLAMVASGDMSHRLRPGAPAGFHPRATDFDHDLIKTLRDGHYRQLLQLNTELQELAAEDAAHSTTIAVASVNWSSVGHEVLSYEAPFGVGYGVAILYHRDGQNSETNAAVSQPAQIQVPEPEKILPWLARCSIEAAFRGEDNIPLTVANGILAEPHGVFVTIRGPHNRLRGCVGTLSPHHENTATETWEVARGAAFHDTRFAPIEPRELKNLRFEVTMVFPPEEITSPSELKPRSHGLIVATEDGRRGVLLPDLQGIDTPERQIAVCRRKGRIGRSEPVRLQRFAVQKFLEPDLN